MLDQETKRYIDGQIAQVKVLGTKKYGDTPTDNNQLTPKRYVTSVVAALPSASPGGNNTEVQFNDSGSFGGDTGLVYNKTDDILTVGASAGLGVVISGNQAIIRARTANQLSLVNGFANSDLLIAPGFGANSQGGPSGKLFLGQSSVDSALPSGLVYINTVTGTPSVVSGTTDYVPLIYDTSANKLWAQNGGTWRSVTFT